MAGAEEERQCVSTNGPRLLKTGDYSLIPSRQAPFGSGDGAKAHAWLPAPPKSLKKEDMDMRSAFDFSPYRRSTVGFDRLFDMLENSSVGQNGENYPPFDLIRSGENEYRIDIAVAGFKPDEIDITAHQNVLIVSGRRKEEADDTGPSYVYRGIATRSFERRFALADHVQVRNADMRDGLLSIDLAREIPEAMKPRKISINGGAEQSREQSAIGSEEASRQTVDAQANREREHA